MRVTFTLGEVISTPAEELRELALSRLIDENAVSCGLPTRDGDFRIVGHATARNGEVTLALVHGDPGPGSPVFTHVSCLMGDTFGSTLCNCRQELNRATAAIVAAGAGVLAYSKPVSDDPFSCPAGRQVDPLLVSALLRHVGVAEAAFEPVAERAA